MLEGGQTLNRKVVSGLTIILLIVLVALLFIYSQSMGSMVQAQEETVELVSLDHTVEKVNDFYWVTIDESYFTLDFTDENGNQIYAIVTQDGGDIQYYTSQDIISHQDALSITLSENEPTKLLQPRLGMMDNQPVWEISFKADNNTLSYYYINASNGEWIQTIANI